MNFNTKGFTVNEDRAPSAAETERLRGFNLVKQSSEGFVMDSSWSHDQVNFHLLQMFPSLFNKILSKKDKIENPCYDAESLADVAGFEYLPPYCLLLKEAKSTRLSLCPNFFFDGQSLRNSCKPGSRRSGTESTIYLGTLQCSECDSRWRN